MVIDTTIRFCRTVGKVGHGNAAIDRRQMKVEKGLTGNSARCFAFKSGGLQESVLEFEAAKLRTVECSFKTFAHGVGMNRFTMKKQAPI